MASVPIRVALLDDHLLLLDAVAERINSHPQMEVVVKATNADEGLRGILETRPDVAVLDVELPGRGVFEMAGEVRARQKNTKILFLTGYCSDVFIEHALRAKAHGYLIKGEPIEFLLDSILRVASGEKCFSQQVANRMDFDESRNRHTLRSDTPLSNLTSRQLEVLRHLARGESVKEVAKSMHLSQKSVDSHKYRIMHKLGIHDRVKLACYAIREGLSLP